MNPTPNPNSVPRWRHWCASASLILLSWAFPAVAVPVVKTVPWVAANPLIPHDTWSGKLVTLKGTSDIQGVNVEYFWDFGDGSPVVSGTVNNAYVIEARHAYVGLPGTVFTATLTIHDTSTGESASKPYYVKIEPQVLQTEVNVAIDEGLWYLHKTMTRTVDAGLWGGFYVAITAANVNAFEANGHLEGGSPDNPYTETVARGLRYVFSQLNWVTLNPAAEPFDPESGQTSPNGIGIYVNQSYPFYQGGSIIDAIIASGTPNALAPTGPANVLGRTYKEIVQDMVDYYSAGQYDNTSYGGWRYNYDDFPDNSASQWAAIGLIPAERNWGCIIPSEVKAANLQWLTYSQRADGVYGYTDQNPLSGVPYGTTPSGLVQCALDGVGRGNPLWDKAETFLRNNFENAGGYNVNLKKNYYGLFAFVKSMLLHDSNGDGVTEPIQFLQSTTAGVNPIDWYLAQTATYGGTDPTDGVARSLVNDQTLDNTSSHGSWAPFGWFDSYGFQTAWAVLMLNRTLFEAGAPVAVAVATPNPAVAGQIIQLDGSGSFHQDATKIIDSWDWDLDNNGSFEASGPFPTVTFPVVGSYPVKLRVTDNGSPEKSAETVLTILVSTPPLAPTANAGGPYSFCPQAVPWFLNGSGSNNPDEGQSEPGAPGDTIADYDWDLDGDGQFDDATGAVPDVSAFFQGAGPGSYLIQLRVTDTSGTSFPSSTLGDLSDTDSAVVVVRSNTDPLCDCVDDLTARPKAGKVQLVWSSTGAHHYNIYRGTVAGGPYVKIAATTSTYSTYLDTGSLVNGTAYYYVVRPAGLADDEICQSNEAAATPRTR